MLSLQYVIPALCVTINLNIPSQICIGDETVQEVKGAWATWKQSTVSETE